MPDWLTHSLIGWITGKIIKSDVALLVIGSLLPDIEKISVVDNWFGIHSEQFLAPFHTPAGAFLIGGLLALFFESPKKAFIPLSIGITTHFILDVFLFNSSGGLRLLFPFSWEGWQYDVISSGDDWITIIAIYAAAFVYIIYLYYTNLTSKNNM
jgi:hypothetical protein